jgi:hypothetical protein
MSRHLALDPREPPVSVTMPRQGQPPADGSTPTHPATDAPTDQARPGLRRRGRKDGEGEPAPLDQALPSGRPAARHHSGIERRVLRRSRSTVPSVLASGAAPGPADAGAGTDGHPEPSGSRIRLGRALVALVGAAVAAGLATAWAYNSWDGNRTLSQQANAEVSAVVLLDAVADTSQFSFVAGQSPQVGVQVTNPYPRTVNVSSIEPKTVALVDPVQPGCSADQITVLPPSVEGLAVPPGGAVFNATVAMDRDAPPECNGSAIAISFVVQGRFARP